ncbi:MAG: DNA-directed RNA polymerase subunit beta [Acidimicrobiaceae bacterium]|nr:DNA-directed RNA polymerase subunit beta [Acidimicrobiaceae bacterium]
MTDRAATRERYSFGNLKQILEMPDLIAIQSKSFSKFLNEGLAQAFRDISPITDYSGMLQLELELELEDEDLLPPPKFTVEECKEKDMTYSSPVFARARFLNGHTGEIKEQVVFMGDFPKMTDYGTFIINGTERVVVSQLVRSPGVIFQPGERYRLRNFAKHQLVTGTIHPYRGEWVEFDVEQRPHKEVTAGVRVARKRRLPLFTLLRALGYGEEKHPNFLRDFVDHFDFLEEQWDKQAHIGPTQTEALIEIYKRVRPGEPATAETARSYFERAFFTPRRYDLSRVGRHKLNRKLKAELEFLNETFGLGLREADPDDPDTTHPELSLPHPEQSHLSPCEMLATASYMLNLAKGEPGYRLDDQDHFANRRIRSVGELIQNQVRIGLTRMERVVRDRMTTQELEAMTPQTLINIRSVVTALKEFFGSSQLSQFMDQTNPLAGLIHRRRISALGPGGLSRERAGFEVRDVHFSHYGRMCPIETPEGPNIGLIGALASFARINDHGFIESPYRIVEGGKATDQVVYLAADDEEEYVIAQANTPIDDQGNFEHERVLARLSPQATSLQDLRLQLERDVFFGATTEITFVSPTEVQMMDISPQQIVSVATALIPFLEHNDANRALMGANMQRQAVPLIRSEAPYVGTGVEGRTARDAGDVVTAAGRGVVSSLSAGHIEVGYGDIKELEELEAKKRGLDEQIDQKKRAVKRDTEKLEELSEQIRQAEQAVEDAKTDEETLLRQKRYCLGYYDAEEDEKKKIGRTAEIIGLDKTFAAIDFEGTNDWVYELGVAVFVDGELEDSYSTLIRPLNAYEDDFDKWLEKRKQRFGTVDKRELPNFRKAWGDVSEILDKHEILDEHIVVAHNASGADIPVLGKTVESANLNPRSFVARIPLLRKFSRRHEYSPRSFHYACTLAVAKSVLPKSVLPIPESDEYHYGLRNLCDYLKIEFDRPHEALEDAKATGKVWLKLAEYAKGEHHAALLSQYGYRLGYYDSQDDKGKIFSKVKRGYDEVTEEEIRGIEKSLEELEAKKRDLNERISQANQAVKRGTKKLEELDGQIRDLGYVGYVEVLLRKFERSNQDTCVNQKPLVRLGDEVEKGDILADGPSTDHGELALGKNLMVAFMPWEGYNFEDAIVLSERLVRDDVLTSVHIHEYEIDARDTKLGVEEITRDIPNLSEDILADLDRRGIVRIGAEVEPGDVLVGKVTPKGETELSGEERLLRAIFGDKARDVRDNSLKVPHGEGGKVVDVKVFDRDDNHELPPGVNQLVRVYVAQIRKISVGDKLAGRHGNKGVISRILPMEDMPFTADGTPVDIILNPLGVPSRMNVGQVLEAHLGYCARWGWKIDGEQVGDEPVRDTERKTRPSSPPSCFVATPVFDGAVWDEKTKSPDNPTIVDILANINPESADGQRLIGVDGKQTLYNGRTGEPYDTPITTGYVYVLKLAHLVDDKIHARSTGPYSMIHQQPLGGKAQFGGQRFGEMEVWALEAYGAAYCLQELLTLKSDDVAGRARVYEAIVKGKNVPEPGIPESFRVLIKEMQSLCLNVEVLSSNGMEMQLHELDEDSLSNLADLGISLHRPERGSDKEDKTREAMLVGTSR